MVASRNVPRAALLALLGAGLGAAGCQHAPAVATPTARSRPAPPDAGEHLVRRAVKVKLPGARRSRVDPSRVQVSVYLAADGALFVGSHPVDPADLPQVLRRRVAKARARHETVELILGVDERARHGAVMHVIEVAKQAGIQRLAIAVKQAGAPAGRPKKTVDGSR